MKKKDTDDCRVIQSTPIHIETRVALLEQSIRHINESFRSIDGNLREIKKHMKHDFRFIITAFCGLAAVMAHGFKWF